MARPVNQLSQEGGQARGGSVFPQKMRLHDRQRRAERLVRFTTNYNTPHPHYMGGTMYALQCSAMQFPVALRLAMLSLYATHHSPSHPHLMSGPAGGHQQADPAERGWQDRSSATGDRSAHSESGEPRLLAKTPCPRRVKGAKAPEVPEYETPATQQEAGEEVDAEVEMEVEPTPEGGEE